MLRFELQIEDKPHPIRFDVEFEWLSLAMYATHSGQSSCGQMGLTFADVEICNVVKRRR